jgi:hypothetical protein
MLGFTLVNASGSPWNDYRDYIGFVGSAIDIFDGNNEGEEFVLPWYNLEDWEISVCAEDFSNSNL